jgi:hypothetical protein
MKTVAAQAGVDVSLWLRFLVDRELKRLGAIEGGEEMLMEKYEVEIIRTQRATIIITATSPGKAIDQDVVNEMSARVDWLNNEEHWTNNSVPPVIKVRKLEENSHLSLG